MKRITKIDKLKWLIIATFVFVVLGIALDWRGFLVNTFSGILGATIGVWVSVEVVETTLNKRRETEWEMIKDSVLRDINFHLTQSCLEYFSLLPAIGSFVILMNDISVITEKKVAVVNNLCNSIASVDVTVIEKARLLKLYDSVIPHINKLNEMKMFYILVPGSERELVRQLQDVERTAANWSEIIFLAGKTSLTKKILLEKASITLTAISSTMATTITHLS